MNPPILIGAKKSIYKFTLGVMKVKGSTLLLINLSYLDT